MSNIRCGQVGDEVLNLVDGKPIRKAIDVIEERVLGCKNKVSKRKECDGKSVSNSKKEDELSKLRDQEKKQVADHGVQGQLVGEKLVQGTEIEAKFALGSVDHIVALGTVVEHNDPSQVCHGYPLGDSNLRVSVSVAIEENALVPFPVGDEIRTVRQAIGSWVAWPKELVIMSSVKKPEKRRKKKVVQEDDLSEDEFSLQSLAASLPNSLRMLCMWGEVGFKDGKAITIQIEAEVFGRARKTFILGQDVRRIATMRELTGNCIVIYQRYLYDVLSQYKMLDMVAFNDPAMIGAIGCGKGQERSQHIKERLISAKPGQIFMLPYNSDKHWVLTIVDPEQEIVYFMDPMKRRLPTGEWVSIVDSAISMYNAHKGRKGRSSPLWKNLSGIPPQPSSKECGYFIM
ncbi:putative Ulp1 protease family catalytic domain, transposase, Tnp1/En/Spm [Rosa chinensis]|uniref:Putative Ulp1 protease family catalytic domain, transposase, Tnp1/En/Spm n=1 Tax=Rosa chinensis TaxID=74649 RepID=A0A2P6S7N2_ROSCH|nr:putative Ulp1 protease family catalytic domain, transposase, Tnp1/En/Spm [Rosa chinensis]